MRALRVAPTVLALSCLLVFAAAGCGDDDRVTPPADSGPRTDGPTGTDSGPRPDGGSPCDGVDCSDMDDACNTGMCNPATGACEASPRPDGTACTDTCIAGGMCAAGGCAGGTPAVDCTGMDDACHVGVCDPTDGSCSAMPRADGTTCDDGMACTMGDVCTGGTCGGGAVDCSPMMDACNSAACDPATGMCVRTAVADGMACDDMNTCTSGDACTAGACGGTPMDCSALTTGCTTGVCNPTTGMCEGMTAADGTACDDANVCTMTDVCAAGTCIGSAVPQCNAMCAAPTRVMAGTMLPLQDTNFGVDDLTSTGGSCGTTSLFNALYYIVNIPAGQAVRVTATPLSAWNPVIRVLPSCGATTCLGSSNSGLTSAPEIMLYSNTGAVAADFLIAVGSASNTTLGSFDLAVDIVSAPANVACSAATRVTAGTPVPAQDATFGSDDLTNTGGACGTTVLFNALYYVFNVPAGQALRAAATPLSAWNPVIRVLPSCGATTCNANANSGLTSAVETAYWTNTGTTATDVIIAVGSAAVTPVGSFDLVVDLLTPPANVSCSGAIAVTAGTSLMGQQESFGADDFGAPGCGTTVNDVLYYSTTIPAAQRLTTTVTRVGTTFDPAVAILPACGATMCLSARNTTTNPEVFTYGNSTGAPLPVIIAIGSSGTTRGDFGVTFAFSPIPYVVTTIPAACQDMSAATVVPSVIGDDAASPSAPLPFAFTLMSSPMMSYSIATNGNVQLFTTATGIGSTAFSNVSIPNTALPNGLVAPLWDDLVSTGTSDARILTVGTAPNRTFVVQWTDWEFFSGVAGTVRFQAKLYETTNVIEYHYCALAGTDPQFTGGSGTIGVENSAGTDGYEYSFSAAGAISTANALRFTPVP